MKTHSIKSIIQKLAVNSYKKYLPKEFCVLSCILIAFMLSGCSAYDYILHESNIMSEADYQKYIELKNTNQLDENGFYIFSEIDNTEETSISSDNSIHVVFCDNAYLEISYFSDAELTKPVDTHACYLKPNDYIYASKPICKHPISNCYSFDQFHVYAYDNNGYKSNELIWNDNKQTLQNENTDEESSLLVLCVPTDYEGTEISVVPLGKYEDRSLQLTDYYLDNTGTKQELAGSWIVNEKEITEKTTQVSPFDPVSIDFKYDAEKYCYVSSNPSSFYHENGLVRFETIYANDNIDEYSVELRSLEEAQFSFKPSDYSVEHGTITFEYRGRIIAEDEECFIDDNESIIYTALPEKNYHHPQNTGQIIVNAAKPDDTKKQIEEAVKFYPNKPVQVILPRPTGGTITYTAEGKTLSGNTCTLLAGTIITMNFTHWNGWKSNLMDGQEYIVTEQETNQTVSLKGIDIYTDVFEESNEHKPTLNVVLTDSVEEDATFTISASGILEEGLNYETGNKTSYIPDWLGPNDRTIFSGKIGTEQGIALDMYGTIFNGYAIKLDIIIEDIKNNEYHSIQYVENIPTTETIILYNDNEISDSSTIYKNITITISKVEIDTYNTKTIDHATITVKPADVTEPYILKDGDVLEASRNIEVTVTPLDGYYITNPENSNDVYCDTMKYSKWEEDYKKILDKHPVKKIWSVTLDSSDNYGTCVYKLDGNVVSDTIKIYEGQKLTLDYTLTDSNYQISRKGVSGLWGKLSHKKTEQYTIPVSESLDNQTIKRSDYITVELKGE